MSPLPQRKKSPEEIAKLRESFGIPEAGQDKDAVPATEDQPANKQTVPPVTPPADVPASKSIRSLRKSEQSATDPSQRPESPPDSNLPHQRHSSDELEEIRRREVLAMMNTPPDRRLFPAHPALIAPGYLATVTAVAGIWFYRIPPVATAACAVLSFAVAGVIFTRFPVSRHHAAFIAVLALLLLIFSALYYFPQLRHAT